MRRDLETYRARVVKPLELRLGHATVYNLPPPTQGVTTLMILGMFERLGSSKAESPEHHHALIEASKRAFTIGEQVVADPMNLVHDPAAFLTSSALERRLRIDMRRASPIRCRARRRATRSGWGRSTRTAWRSPTSSRCSGPSGPAVLPRDRNPLAQPGHGLLPRPGEPQSVAAGPQAVPHPQPAPGGLRRRAGPVLRHHGRRRSRRFWPRSSRDMPPSEWASPMRSTRRAGSSTRAGAQRPPHCAWRAASIRALSRPRALGHEVEEGSEPYVDNFGHAGMLVKHPRNGRVEATHDPRSDGGALGL